MKLRRFSHEVYALFTWSLLSFHMNFKLLPHEDLAARICTVLTCLYFFKIIHPFFKATYLGKPTPKSSPLTTCVFTFVGRPGWIPLNATAYHTTKKYTTFDAIYVKGDRFEKKGSFSRWPQSAIIKGFLGKKKTHDITRVAATFLPGKNLTLGWVANQPLRLARVIIIRRNKKAEKKRQMVYVMDWWGLANFLKCRTMESFRYLWTYLMGIGNHLYLRAILLSGSRCLVACDFEKISISIECGHRKW